MELAAAARGPKVVFLWRLELSELVYHADGEAHDGKKEAVAFFSAPSPVQAIACTGDQIGIGCQSGFVLHLQASWLVEA